MRDVVEIIAAVLAFALFAAIMDRLDDADRARKLERAARPSCSSLYTMAHTSADSLTVALTRGDCAP